MSWEKHSLGRGQKCRRAKFRHVMVDVLTGFKFDFGHEIKTKSGESTETPRH